MGSRGGQGVGSVGVHILVSRIDLLFILNLFRGDSFMTDWVLICNSIGYSVENIYMLATEGVGHI